ncbi:Nn.00g041240.m01.CDS01 [Neocucurbitaria sp. VM-36]
MESRSTSPFSGLVALLSIFLFIMPATADFTVSYCSNQNTGSTDDVFNWTWQSNGKCTDHCNSQGTYAFAVIQYKDCWCTNYIPADQEDTSGCMVDCPGFPSEKCGDKDKGLYIYIKLDGSPSGTQGGSQPTSTDSPKTSSTLKPVPATTEEDPMTSTWVVTESGAIITRTVVVSPSSVPARTEGNSGGKNTGAIVGGVVGGVLGLLAIIGVVFFALWRRRKQQQEQQQGQVGGSSGITRNTSTMSKAGLLGNHGEKDIQYPPQIMTNFSTHGSSRHDGDSISPITASDRRYSQPLMIDSRLDPRAVLTFHGANVSRDSLASIDDSRDYGRQLNVRNPDPEH